MATTVPVYDAVDVAARAIGRVADYAAWLVAGRWRGVRPRPGGGRGRPGDRVEEPARAHGLLDLDATAQVLADHRCRGGADRSGRHPRRALAAADRVGYPVALKADRRGVMAKIVAAGLALDLADAAALRSAWGRMAARFADGLVPALVQPMVEPGIDVAIAVLDHPEWGRSSPCARGGANAALDLAAELQLLPFRDEDARRLVGRSRLAPHLNDASRACLETCSFGSARWSRRCPSSWSLSANPVIIGGGQAIAIEVSAEVAEVERRAPLRRLDSAASVRLAGQAQQRARRGCCAGSFVVPPMIV